MKLKRFWGAVAVLLLLSLASVWNEGCYRSISSRMDACLREAVALVREGELEEGMRQMEAFERQANGLLPFLNMTTSHHEVDELMLVLSRSMACLELGQTGKFLVEAAELLEKIEHIDMSERIRWDNIL